MNSKSIYPVILCGGEGKRLWPLSTPSNPKPFITLLQGQSSLFCQTFQRFSGPGFAKKIVVCGEKHLVLAQNQLSSKQQDDTLFIAEPVAANTAVAAGLSALALLAEDKQAVMLIAPGDHFIPNPEVLYDALPDALDQVEQGKLVVFGIKPDSPHTGYGYIQPSQGSGLGIVSSVHRFTEKPDLVTARYFLDSKEYVWNSGMLCCRADAYIAALKEYAPDILHCCQDVFHSGARRGNVLTPRTEELYGSNYPSFDYAILEKISDLSVITLDMEWADIGDWSALEVYSRKMGIPLISDISRSQIYTMHYKGSPVGDLHITSDNHGVTSLKMLNGNDSHDSISESCLLLDECKKQLDAYFSGRLKDFNLPLNPSGTPFQKRVWQALTTVPCGQTVSYGAIAQQIGNAGAVRAVGQANNRNPIGLIVPCHRVIGADGSLTGYAGGIEKKSWLLEHERNIDRINMQVA